MTRYAHPVTGEPLDPEVAMVTVPEFLEGRHPWALELGATIATAVATVTLEAGDDCRDAQLLVVRRFAQDGSARGHLPLGPPTVHHAHTSDPDELAELLELATSRCSCGSATCVEGPILGPSEELETREALANGARSAGGAVLALVYTVVIPEALNDVEHLAWAAAYQAARADVAGLAHRPILERRT